MSEVNSDVAVETKKPENQPFSLPVEINGMSYLFEGEIPVKSGSFEWDLRVPNWQEQGARIQEDVKTGGVSSALPFALGEFEREKGSIGNVHVNLAKHHIQLGSIRTKTWMLPQEFGYQNAKGVGNFLMRNLTTFADIKGLPVFLEPYPDGSSPLSYDETREWYKRLGFKFVHELPEEADLPRAHGSMVRLPGQPDLTQQVAKVIQTN